MIKRHVYFVTILSLSMGFGWANETADYDCFYPGKEWLDTSGAAINAHGGGVLFHEGVYYWFGQHMIEGKAGNRAQVGVHCYSSKDLYNWDDEGIALAVSTEPGHDIEKGCILERPKVIHNDDTGKFVMYFHLELKDQEYDSARTGIAVASTVTGPYTYLRSYRPNAGHWPINVTPEQKDPLTIAEARRQNDDFSGGPTEKHRKFNILGAHFEGGQMARDMNLFVDHDGKAYHLYSSEHNSSLHIAQLTEDYLGHSGLYTRNFPLRWMEAPAVCKYLDKYWFIASGCSGWAPNAARSAVADNIFGPWKELGNPCIGTNPHNNLNEDKTFGGQSTFILPVAGKEGAFIAMFDVWQPENAIDGRYVWLPIEWEEDRFVIRWRDEWALSVFDAKQETPVK